MKTKTISFKMESGRPEGGALTRAPPAGGREVRDISAREDIFHKGTLCPAFKKKNGDPSPPQQQCAHRHSLEHLFFSHELWFETVLPSFLLTLGESGPSLRLSSLARGSLPCVSQVASFRWSPINSLFT